MFDWLIIRAYVTAITDTPDIQFAVKDQWSDGSGGLNNLNGGSSGSWTPVATDEDFAVAFGTFGVFTKPAYIDDHVHKYPLLHSSILSVIHNNTDPITYFIEALFGRL